MPAPMRGGDRPSRPSAGRGGSERSGSGEGITSKLAGFAKNAIILIVIIVVIVAVIRSGVLGGILSSTPIGGVVGAVTESTGVGSGGTGATAASRLAKSADRTDHWTTVRDINGNEITTVIYLDPIASDDFDMDLAKDVLTRSGVNWYQIVWLDGKNAPGVHERALLYMPVTSTASDMSTVNGIIGGAFNAHVMGKGEYESYLADAPRDGILGLTAGSGNEMVEFGPASVGA